MIESKGSNTVKNVAFLLSLTAFGILITFGHIPRVKNRQYHFHFLYNEGTMESVSMFTRIVSTPLLFLFKFIVKSLVYKGRTVIIKMPLVRHVMLKRRLQGFLRRRAEGKSRSMGRLLSSLSEPRILAD